MGISFIFGGSVLLNWFLNKFRSFNLGNFLIFWGIVLFKLFIEIFKFFKFKVLMELGNFLLSLFIYNCKYVKFFSKNNLFGILFIKLLFDKFKCLRLDRLVKFLGILLIRE